VSLLHRLLDTGMEFLRAKGAAGLQVDRPENPLAGRRTATELTQEDQNQHDPAFSDAVGSGEETNLKPPGVLQSSVALDQLVVGGDTNRY
jgi:hypothetical protein